MKSGPGDGVVLLVHVEALLGVEVVLDDDDAVLSQRLPASPEKRHKVLCKAATELGVSRARDVQARMVATKKKGGCVPSVR
jgi:hypothetical protein